MNNNKRNITIHVLAGVTAIAQLAAGFVLVTSNKKNIALASDQRVESYASEETLADQSNVVIDKASDIEKATTPIMPPIGENDLIRTARNRYILNNIKDSLDEKNNSQAEAIVDQSNVSFEKEANIVKGKVNLPPYTNIGEPYGPWDKTNPVNEAVHQHTMDIINNNDDIKENAIVKGKVNLPPYTNIGEPYGPWDKTNPVYEAIHQHTMDVANRNHLDEYFPYIEKIYENQLYDMDPSLKPPVNPPYIPQTTDGTIPAPTEISAESMVKEIQNPVYNEIKDNSKYMSAINQNILYDLDPSLKPPVNPPFIPNEDSDEHTRSI